ncbi:MAG TPA: hypothetical protein VES40_08230 [Ilumatobacteraceae bacterium]|nr:hypothetical protein [Ilumatobacteraceae bacterium]
MLRGSLSVVVIVVAVFASACASSSDPVSETDEKVGSFGDAVEVAAGAPAGADDAACAADRQTLETATEMFYSLNGAEPTSQDDLVATGLIAELSPRFVITPEGVIEPAPGSPCA